MNVAHTKYKGIDLSSRFYLFTYDERVDLSPPSVCVISMQVVRLSLATAFLQAVQSSFPAVAYSTQYADTSQSLAAPTSALERKL